MTDETNNPSEADQQDQVTGTPPDDDDVDALALQEALKAAQAEEAAKKEPEDKDVEPEKEPEAKTSEKDQQKDDEAAKEEKPAPEMIPKARFDEVLAKLNESTQATAYFQGQLEALKSKPEKVEPKAEPTPEERIATVREGKLALARKLDEGEISTAEWEAERQKLDDIEINARFEINRPKEQPAQQPSTNDDLYLETASVQLERDHPYLKHMGTDDFQYLKAKATKELIEQEVLPSNGRMTNNSQLLAMRTRIAELSSEWGQRLTGKSPEEVGIKVTEPEAPRESAEAKARREKLEAAKDMPPDISKMNGQPGDNPLTAERIATMTEDEFAALPQSARNKILGTT